jgi:hypothetical protein
MSKSSSGLFASTTGAIVDISLSPSAVVSTITKTGTRSIDPNLVRFSQTSVNGSAEIIESMKKYGWRGSPVDVVIMSDGKLTTLDNTRVVAARAAGIKVKARVHNHSDQLPNRATAERFTTSKGGVPSTWGQAVENRIGKQSQSFRRNNPYGSYNMKNIK